MLRAVLFDLDDTLVDHGTAATAAIIAWAAQQGITDPEAVRRWADLSEVHYARYQRRELTFTEQGRERVRDFLSTRMDNDTADELYSDYLRQYEARWTTFEDAVPALRRARASGMIVAVLTNGDEDHQRFKVEALGLANEIDVFIASSMLPASKPEIIAFLSALELLGVDPNEALMIGNSLSHDVRGALSARLDAVLLDRDNLHPDTEVTRVKTLAELRFEPLQRSALLGD